MTVQTLIQEVRHLTLDERQQLMDALIELMAQTPSNRNKSLRSFRGIGARLYDGTDAQEYLNEMRDEWDSRI